MFTLGKRQLGKCSEEAFRQTVKFANFRFSVNNPWPWSSRSEAVRRRASIPEQINAAAFPHQGY